LFSVVVLGSIVACSGGGDGGTSGSLLSGDQCSVQNAYELIRPSVVRITTNSGEGAGFFVERNTVLTAAHVITGSNEVAVELSNGTAATGFVIAKNTSVDMALLSVEVTCPHSLYHA
jgi:S1-C subfamily serine protease